MTKFLPILKNKYYLSLIVFFIWMMFLDRNDFIAQYQYRSKLSQLKKDKAYYEEEILKVRKDLEELTTNQSELEKFAREKYLMKRDNEDVFVIIKE